MSDVAERLRLPHNWQPREYQKASWRAWKSGIRRMLLVWHRRAGKDELALHLTCVAAHRRVANYWHCLPLYVQAKKAIWEAVNPHTGKRRIDEAFPKELRARTDNQSMTIEFLNGSIWRVVGSDNPDSLVGAPPAGIVFSEWALANPSAWGYLAPILDENGGWAIFITTPRGRNHVKSMLDMANDSEEWFAEVLTPKETGYPQDRIEVQRKEYHAIFGQDAGDALIEQEYWCSFEAAVLGAYWGKEMVKAEQEGRICDVPHDPDMPVETAWDLGVGDSTAIWFYQVLRGGIHIIDFYEASGYGADHYAGVLDKRREELGYRYGKHWIPHDGRVKEWGSGKTRVETLLSLGHRPDVVPLSGVDDGINAARQILPSCRFDKARTADGLERLRAYKRKWDDDKKVFSNTPLHDWTSHAADAFRYLAMARNVAPKAPDTSAPPKPSLTSSVQDMLRRQDMLDKQKARL